MKTVLTIAGSDPTSGAGLQADIRVFNYFNVYGLSVVSAITAQNTYEVNVISSVEGRLLEKQLNTLLSDIRPDAVKTGMLFSVDAVSVVSKITKGFDLQNLVIDPVTISSTGTSLMENGVLDILKEELFPLAKVITPNIYEASVISGVNIDNEDDVKKAARELKRFGSEVVIITGGHYEIRTQITDHRSQITEHRVQNTEYRTRETEVNDKKSTTKEIMDVLYDGHSFYCIKGKKIKGEYHGTGCAFSAAIAANIAMGMSVKESAKKAKEFVDAAISGAFSIGKGMNLLKI